MAVLKNINSTASKSKGARPPLPGWQMYEAPFSTAPFLPPSYTLFFELDEGDGIVRYACFVYKYGNLVHPRKMDTGRNQLVRQDRHPPFLDQIYLEILYFAFLSNLLTLGISQL